MLVPTLARANVGHTYEGVLRGVFVGRLLIAQGTGQAERVADRLYVCRHIDFPRARYGRQAFLGAVWKNECVGCQLLDWEVRQTDGRSRFDVPL